MKPHRQNVLDYLNFGPRDAPKPDDFMAGVGGSAKKGRRASALWAAEWIGAYKAAERAVIERAERDRR